MKINRDKTHNKIYDLVYTTPSREEFRTFYGTFIFWSTYAKFHSEVGRGLEGSVTNALLEKACLTKSI